MKKLAVLFALMAIVVSGCTTAPANDMNSTTNVYVTEQECEQAESCECAYQSCDFVPEGKTYEEVCGENFRKGWVCKNDDMGDDAMAKVEQGDSIKVEYVGTFPDTGEEFDKSAGRGPLAFVAGSGQVVVGFDEAVIGMELNEEKTVTIPPEKAYGTLADAKRVEAPVSQIGDGNVTVGTTVYTNTGMQGTIIAIDENGTATIEFVHPLAGKTLQFWIKIVEIEKA